VPDLTCQSAAQDHLLFGDDHGLIGTAEALSKDSTSMAVRRKKVLGVSLVCIVARITPWYSNRQQSREKLFEE
jgi:hypothetical protein